LILIMHQFWSALVVAFLSRRARDARRASRLLDQSFARISADIFDAGGISGIECWVIGYCEAHASSNSQRPLAQCVCNLNWVVGFGKETAALWQILLR